MQPWKICGVTLWSDGTSSMIRNTRFAVILDTRDWHSMEGPLPQLAPRLANSRLVLHSPTCTRRDRQVHRVSHLRHPGSRSLVESHRLPIPRHQVRHRVRRSHSRSPSLSINNLPEHISLTTVLAIQIIRHRRLIPPQTSNNINIRTRLPRTNLGMLQPIPHRQAKVL